MEVYIYNNNINYGSFDYIYIYNSINLIKFKYYILMYVFNL